MTNLLCYRSSPGQIDFLYPRASQSMIDVADYELQGAIGGIGPFGVTNLIAQDGNSTTGALRRKKSTARQAESYVRETQPDLYFSAGAPSAV